jgi:hypothetical protein
MAERVKWVFYLFYLVGELWLFAGGFAEFLVIRGGSCVVNLWWNAW